MGGGVITEDERRDSVSQRTGGEIESRAKPAIAIGGGGTEGADQRGAADRELLGHREAVLGPRAFEPRGEEQVGGEQPTVDDGKPVVAEVGRSRRIAGRRRSGTGQGRRGLDAGHRGGTGRGAHGLGLEAQQAQPVTRDQRRGSRGGIEPAGGILGLDRRRCEDGELPAPHQRVDERGGQARAGAVDAARVAAADVRGGGQRIGARDAERRHPAVIAQRLAQARRIERQPFGFRQGGGGGEIPLADRVLEFVEPDIEESAGFAKRALQVIVGAEGDLPRPRFGGDGQAARAKHRSPAKDALQRDAREVLREQQLPLDQVRPQRTLGEDRRDVAFELTGQRLGRGSRTDLRFTDVTFDDHQSDDAVLDLLLGQDGPTEQIAPTTIEGLDLRGDLA